MSNYSQVDTATHIFLPKDSHQRLKKKKILRLYSDRTCINKEGEIMSNYSQVTPVVKTSLHKGRIIRMKQLLEKLPFTASHIYSLIKENKFPKPFQLIPNGRAKGWHESVIDQWIIENTRSQ